MWFNTKKIKKYHNYFVHGTENFYYSSVVVNHVETQLLSRKAGHFRQSSNDISFLGKDKALMGYIDFSSKYCEIPRFIIVAVAGFSERNRRFLRPTCCHWNIHNGWILGPTAIWLLITNVQWIDQGSETHCVIHGTFNVSFFPTKNVELINFNSFNRK